MYREYIGKIMTYKQAYFAFEGYNFVMTDLEENERGTNYKGRVICISNDPLELRAAVNKYNDRPCALLQGKMEEIDVPGVTLGGSLVHESC